MSVNELGFLSPETERFRQKIRQRHAEFFDPIERASRRYACGQDKFPSA